MTINFGKIDPGGLTASDPAEILYIPFATYNDSGASIAKTGFVVGDIAGSVDANVQQVNDTTVGGTGAAGDRWGAA